MRGWRGRVTTQGLLEGKIQTRKAGDATSSSDDDDDDDEREAVDRGGKGGARAEDTPVARAAMARKFPRRIADEKAAGCMLCELFRCGSTHDMSPTRLFGPCSWPLGSDAQSAQG